MLFSPQFGGSPTKEQIAQYEKTGHYKDKKFLNAEEIKMEINCHSITSMIKGMLFPVSDIAPKKNIEVEKISQESILTDKRTRVTWMGHSSFLIEIDNTKILIDPVFSQYAAPYSFLGRKRYHKEMPITLDNLPFIDAIIISHDHYDHLDYQSIKKLKDKTGKFYTTLGVGNHLRKWGVSESNIIELDWWDETTFETLTFICTPARHMSGRGFTDQSATLWASWIIKGTNDNIYFSGDGGYGKHFKEIGEKYGPFDLGLMECGQYNALWADVHMIPEETVQAGIDIHAKMILPVHWGAFTLAMHSWKEPVIRVTKEANRLNIPITTPQIGEPVILGNDDYPTAHWWNDYD